MHWGVLGTLIGLVVNRTLGLRAQGRLGVEGPKFIMRTESNCNSDINTSTNNP